MALRSGRVKTRLGWLIWWAWPQFTWTLNPADTTHTTVRVITLTATAVALVMFLAALTVLPGPLPGVA